MLARFARVNLRRWMHTSPSRSQINYLSNGRLRMALGASVVAATYLTWHWAKDDHWIALDAQENVSLTKHTSVAAHSLSEKKRPDRVDADPTSLDSSQETTTTKTTTSENSPSPEEGEGNDDGSAAFNPATGEINWDCPCLGGMAHGPCGPQFRAAFECFVFSDQEPKGVDCVDKFKAMQDCFREHPDVYADEIMRDEEEEEEEEQSGLHPEEGEQRPPAVTHEKDTKSDSPSTG